eukprot:403339513
MGIVNDLPVNDRQAQRLNQNHLTNPFYLAAALKNKQLDEQKNGNNRLGRKFIYGGDIPTSVANVVPYHMQKYQESKFEIQNELYPSDPKLVLSNKYNRPRQFNRMSQGIRTFDTNEKLPYMDSSIDLSQNDYNRISYAQQTQEKNMQNFRLKVAEGSGRYQRNLSNGGLGEQLQMQNQNQGFPQQFQTIDNSNIHTNLPSIPQNRQNSKQSKTQSRFSQNQNIRHPYEWQIRNSLQGPIGIIPDQQKITEVDKDHGSTLRKTASQIIQQFYDTKMQSNRRDNLRYSSVNYSPTNLEQYNLQKEGQDSTQNNISHFKNSSFSGNSRALKYHESLNYIDQQQTKVMPPQITLNRIQY